VAGACVFAIAIAGWVFVARERVPLPPDPESQDGYVALGAFDKNQKAYPNFRIVSGASDDGLAEVGAIMSANGSVNLRTNTENTKEGSNSSPVGAIPEKGCVKIIKLAGEMRGLGRRQKIGKVPLADRRFALSAGLGSKTSPHWVMRVTVQLRRAWR
jgi:hypothetical protein